MENSLRRVLLASLAGTTIEFYDFYCFGLAAVLVFPSLFFPESDPNTAVFASLATFAIAFYARPIGAAVLGHFGDRIGRKATLVAALLTMGLSTVIIGALPTYDTAGIAAPALLALCRFGQGFGLGGEWGGAILLATENAPPGKQAWYGMFPQLGVPAGFVLSASAFLLLGHFLTEAQFAAWGWRLPFLASAVLVLVGLYVRLRIVETAAFSRALERNERVRVPMATLFRAHPRALLLSTLATVAVFLVFYLVSVFTLTWGMANGWTREQFLWLQLGAMLCMAACIVVSARLADRHDPRLVLVWATLGMIVYGLVFARLLSANSAVSVLACLSLGMVLVGLAYGPLGAALGSLFPTALRYTGLSVAYNFAGILGGSLTPYAAKWLADQYGLPAVGWYLSAAALITLAALLRIARGAMATRH